MGNPSVAQEWCGRAMLAFASTCVCVSGVEAFEVLTSSQLVMFFERVICQRCVAILHIYIYIYVCIGMYWRKA